MGVPDVVLNQAFHPPCSLAHKLRSSDRGYPESEALHTVARDRFLSRQGDEHVPRSQTSDNISVQPRHQGESNPRSPDCESETVPLRYEDAHGLCSVVVLSRTRNREFAVRRDPDAVAVH